MTRHRHHLTALIALCLLAMTAFAAPPGDGDALDVRYDGHRVVRAMFADAAQIEQMHGLGGRLLSCFEGVGPVDYAVAPEAMAALEASGIDFVVLNENLQVLIDAERARIEANRAAAGGVAAGGAWLFDDFKDLAEINAYLDTLVAVDAANAAAFNRPPLVVGGAKFSLGNSIEGRPINALRLSGAGTGKPQVIFNGCQHAREWISPMMNMYILDRLIRDYDTDPQIGTLLDALEVIVIPVVNPDGYDFSWPPGDRLWRKNRRNNGDGTMGVDNNRNWGTAWGGGGSSGNTSSETYRGTAPFSEPETAAMRDFFLGEPNVFSTIDFHSYSQLVLSPWAYQPGTPSNDNGFHDLVGAQMSQAILGVHGETYVWGPVMDTLYQASGGSVDWTWDVGGALSWTIELRDTGFYGFIMPPEEIIPTCEENFQAALALMEFSRQGVQYTFPTGLPGIVEADLATTVPLTIAPISAGALNPATARLSWRFGAAGSFNETALTHLGGDDYEAVLPAAPCNETIEFYFAIESMTGATYSSPSDAPATLHEAVAFEVVVIHQDDFETDPGWAVSGNANDGQWDRGVPINCDRGDPITDFDGSGQCYLTDNSDNGGNCNSDVDGGQTVLTTTPFDLTGGARITYAYWLNDIPGSDLGPEDSFRVEMSTDPFGSSWQLVREYTTAAAQWRTDAIDIAPDDATATMRLRFMVADNSPGDVVEAGLDALAIERLECDTVPCVADVAGDDGVVNISDLLALLAAWGSNDPTFDIAPVGAPDGIVDIQDLLALLAAWGPCP